MGGTLSCEVWTVAGRLLLVGTLALGVSRGLI